MKRDQAAGESPAAENELSQLQQQERADCVRDLVTANRILAQQGVLDAYGHISARHPSNPERFLISRSLPAALVTEDDIMELDLQLTPAKADVRQQYLEIFIHSEIYKTRPDVMAVIHSHCPSVVPFSVSTVRLRPIYHMGGFLSGGAPVFDIAKLFGCTDLLVRSPEQGAALAAALGDGSICLMRGHGFVTASETVKLAVFQSIYTDLNASLQLQAITLGGEITYLELDEAARAWETNRSTIVKPWELWKSKLQGQDLV